jgi:hypothetical protein
MQNPPLPQPRTTQSSELSICRFFHYPERTVDFTICCVEHHKRKEALGEMTAAPTKLNPNTTLQNCLKHLLIKAFRGSSACSTCSNHKTQTKYIISELHEHSLINRAFREVPATEKPN